MRTDQTLREINSGVAHDLGGDGDRSTATGASTARGSGNLVPPQAPRRRRTARSDVLARGRHSGVWDYRPQSDRRATAGGHHSCLRRLCGRARKTSSVSTPRRRQIARRARSSPFRSRAGPGPRRHCRRRVDCRRPYLTSSCSTVTRSALLYLHHSFAACSVTIWRSVRRRLLRWTGQRLRRGLPTAPARGRAASHRDPRTRFRAARVRRAHPAGRDDHLRGLSRAAPVAVGPSSSARPVLQIDRWGARRSSCGHAPAAQWYRLAADHIWTATTIAGARPHPAAAEAALRAGRAARSPSAASQR